MKRKYNGEDLPDLDLSPKLQQANLQVVVRCRPIIERDLTNNNAECVKVLDEQTLLVTEPYDLDGHSQGEKARKMQFEFERVFDKNASQQEIYRYAFSPLLPGLFEGVNATIFCYGASQAGKTFTIQGQADTPGLLQLGIHDISEMLERPENINSVLKFSYVEIYNEVIKDLLASDDKVLDVREDPVKGVVLSGVSEIITSNKKELITMIK
jgi:kinesin family protein 18/19